MTTSKTATRSFRIDPEMKEAQWTPAGREHCSTANLVAVFVMEYCERKEITHPRRIGALMLSISRR